MKTLEFEESISLCSCLECIKGNLASDVFTTTISDEDVSVSYNKERGQFCVTEVVISGEPAPERLRKCVEDYLNM